MSLKRAWVLFIAATVALPVVVAGGANGTPVAADAGTRTYLDPAYPPAERAADLVWRLSLEEKAAQLNSSRAPAIPRLGIAAYGWWNEAGHGVAREQTNDGDNPPTLVNTTSYPVSLSLGSTWNPGLAYQEASMISDEAREVVRDNRLDLDFYTPTINLSRDPRWGRNDETFSEDPLLTGALAAQFVNGMQGLTQQGTPLPGSGGYLKTIATLKHFAANNSEFNRRNGSSDMDERTLREYYTAQFRYVIQHSAPGSIMSAYNEVNGVPAAANVHLIDTLARQIFGFSGYFTSDCDSIFEIQDGHQWQPDGAKAPLNAYGRTAYAQSAGEDLDCDQGYHDGYNYGNTIPTAIDQHITTPTDVYNENDVDVSLVRLFTARIRLGEFDAENRVPWVAQARARLARAGSAPGGWTNSAENNAVTETPQRLEMARKVGNESIVLLRNASAAGGRPPLPLRVPRSGAYRVAVVGKAAQSMYLGGYSSNQGPAGEAKQVTGYAGLKAALQAINPSATVDLLPATASGAAGAASYNAVVVFAGTDEKTASEDHDRDTLALPDDQATLINQVGAVNPNTIVYLETVGAVDVSGFAARVPAILWSSYNGQMKGASLADVLTGAVNPSGHLPFTWYANLAQLPAMDDYGIRPAGGSNGRTYQYFTGDQSYPFGYGLSYTSFRYAHLTVDRSTVDANGELQVSAEITNTGPVAGAEVVQLYAGTPDAPAALQRPGRRLAGFQKVTLAPHQTTRVAFTLKVPDLAFFDQAANKYTVDSGRYTLQLGSSSMDIRQQALVKVTGALEPKPAVVTAKPVVSGDAARGIAQRVFVPAGSRIDPQLTVSLSDESIFGYVTKGSSTPLPPGMTVSYRSDRPAVVSAGPDGLLAHGAGVATVTATVTYHGGSATGGFVVGVT